MRLAPVRGDTVTPAPHPARDGECLHDNRMRLRDGGDEVSMADTRSLEQSGELCMDATK